MADSNISVLLIEWYRINKRDLPWRHSIDPYIIWISEIILQQTRVVQGMPYFYRFIDYFPNVHELASANEREVLKCWEGLGYYSRARNMHHTAKYIVAILDGIFPNNYQHLLKLKGIGNYTAAAIASFAYGEKVAVLDGNVIRVLSRLFNFELDVNEALNRKKLQLIADSLISSLQPGEFNQAIMEFGALHCLPAQPKCMECTLNHLCEGFLNGNQNKLPFKSKKIKVKNRYFNYLVFIDENNNYYVKERLKGDIWQGLFDFALIETCSEAQNLNEIYKNENFIDIKISYVSSLYKHILTHQIIWAKFWIINILAIELPNIINVETFINCDIDQMNLLPVPKLIKNFLKNQKLL